MHVPAESHFLIADRDTNPLSTAIYGGLFVAMQCTLLSLTHRAYRMYFFGSFFISALISILVEHKGRRQELAVYVFNVGIETIWRMLVDRGNTCAGQHATELT